MRGWRRDTSCKVCGSEPSVAAGSDARIIPAKPGYSLVRILGPPAQLTVVSFS